MNTDNHVQEPYEWNTFSDWAKFRGIDPGRTHDEYVEVWTEARALAARGAAPQGEPRQREEGEVAENFFPNGIAHLQPTIRVACITLDGATLTVPADQLTSHGIGADGDDDIYTLTFKTMTRKEYEALGEFDGF